LLAPRRRSLARARHPARQRDDRRHCSAVARRGFGGVVRRAPFRDRGRERRGPLRRYLAAGGGPEGGAPGRSPRDRLRGSSLCAPLTWSLWPPAGASSRENRPGGPILCDERSRRGPRPCTPSISATTSVSCITWHAERIGGSRRPGSVWMTF